MEKEGSYSRKWGPVDMKEKAIRTDGCQLERSSEEDPIGLGMFEIDSAFLIITKLYVEIL